MKKIIIFLLLFFINSEVNASRSLIYSKYKENPKIYEDHLMSLESGYSWLMTWQNKDIYCKPSNLEISLKNIQQALNLSVTEFKKKGGNPDEFPVEILLIQGLIKLFPC